MVWLCQPPNGNMEVVWRQVAEVVRRGDGGDEVTRDCTLLHEFESDLTRGQCPDHAKSLRIVEGTHAVCHTPSPQCHNDT